MNESNSVALVRFCAAYRCHRTFVEKVGGSGRPRKFCSNACKARAQRLKSEQRKRYETIAAKASAADDLIQQRSGFSDGGGTMLRDAEYSSLFPSTRNVEAHVVRIPRHRVRRAGSKPLPSAAENKARDTRRRLFNLWAQRDRLMRSSLGSSARPLLERISREEATLRSQLRQINQTIGKP